MQGLQLRRQTLSTRGKGGGSTHLTCDAAEAAYIRRDEQARGYQMKNLLHSANSHNQARRRSTIYKSNLPAQE